MSVCLRIFITFSFGCCTLLFSAFSALTYRITRAISGPAHIAKHPVSTRGRSVMFKDIGQRSFACYHDCEIICEQPAQKFDLIKAFLTTLDYGQELENVLPSCSVG